MTLDEPLQAWKILESYVPHGVHKLGISNFKLSMLETIHNQAFVKPFVVQIGPIRRTDTMLKPAKFCRENNIMYQSFGTLTGNPHLLKSEAASALGGAAEVSESVAL
ncbi:hypothetical protein K432DRAFT_161419 [Lepidopterella palustris CBS 459.81]|uniref:NADP-dependent oxidoreductase domain-containing protein n=1 Tax=Lepidopterella palustris CBS 459.81 TaxID=1314670 RepID=A0A8E2JAY3_9PEZI|nr:hypothetical protein K432DRAFT_161419 [Lepidopterella palustris CBS 459.81]